MPLVRTLIVAVMLVVSSAARPAVAEPVRVSAAISLKDALEEAARAYKAAGGGEVEFVFGSSGELMAQIKAGAPADAFISAAGKQVDDLVRAGKVDEATRRVVAGNRLVLIVPAGAAAAGKARPGGFKDLADPAVGRVAIGEPRTVPAGQYAMQVLIALRLADGLGDRLVYGSNVRQVLDYVERGEAAAGVVYATDAKQAGDKVKVVATADPTTHDPIVYPAVVVRASRHKAEAQRFLDFLASEKGKAILAGYGFTDGAPAKAATRPAAVSHAGN
jgi:molybdate transport system substrate-binding protein